MSQCHFISEGWDCGRPSKERCACDGVCDCIGHAHHSQPTDFILLMSNEFEPLSEWEKRMEAVR